MGLLVVGAGGHGAVVVDAARASGWEVVGFADGREEARGTGRLGVHVVAVGEDEGIALALAGGHHVVVAIGAPRVRGRIADRYAAAGVPLATVVHPTAWISPASTVGEGTVVFAGCIVQAGTRVGRSCILNTGCTVDHDTVLEDLVHLSPGVHMGGTVHVGEGTHLGVGVSVRNNVRIGSWSVVGVGAAVVSDLPDDVVCIGVPARPRP
ncbi:MAG: acetyltransferase [Alphaproteobacteria bacterium]|nr:acetyltransferase [Alphaproteobacteria bacterium]MCB9693294.1 acetyltransferase [Alphaproteobacteria bacterium]